MGADPKYTTLSGFSSGGVFSTALFVAHSETFKGVGLHDNFPYAIGDIIPSDCVNVTPEEEPNCFDPEYISTETLSIAKSGKYESDSLDNIKDSPVFIFSQGADPLV